MRERFAAIYTAALADILDARGLHDQTLPPSIRPLEPGTRLAGPAYTVSGRPAATDVVRRRASQGARHARRRSGRPCRRLRLRPGRRGPSRRALGDVAEGARRRRLRPRRRLSRRPLHPRRGLPGLLPLRHARGLDLALGARGDAGADHDRHGADRAGRLGRRRRRRRGRRAAGDRRGRARRSRGEGGDGERDPRRRSRRHARRSRRTSATAPSECYSVDRGTSLPRCSPRSDAYSRLKARRRRGFQAGSSRCSRCP